MTKKPSLKTIAERSSLELTHMFISKCFDYAQSNPNEGLELQTREYFELFCFLNGMGPRAPEAMELGRAYEQYFEKNGIGSEPLSHLDHYLILNNLES